MDQLVSDDVLQTGDRLPRKFSIQANPVGVPAATAPLGFHSLYVYTFYRNAELLLPPLQQRWHLLSNLLAVILLNKLGFSVLGCPRPNARDQNSTVNSPQTPVLFCLERVRGLSVECHRKTDGFPHLSLLGALRMPEAKCREYMALNSIGPARVNKRSVSQIPRVK